MENKKNKIVVTNFLTFNGGLFFNLLAKVSGHSKALNLLTSQIWFISIIAWLPLFPLILFNQDLFNNVQISFLLDIELHSRLLLVVPLLIVAEKFVQNKLSPVAEELIFTGLIPHEHLLDYQKILDSTNRLLNSYLVEALILISSFVILPLIWLTEIHSAGSSWYAVREGTRTIFSPAGYWYIFVSLPLLRFLLLRWYFRIFVWYRFLWKVSRLPLKINSLHPDQVGGLGILENKLLGMLPIWFCHSIILSSLIANRIWYAGASLTQFLPEIVTLLLIQVAIILLPVAFFIPALLKNKNKSLIKFSSYAGSYVDAFWSKWVSADQFRHHPELLGNPDIQTLADFGSSYDNLLNSRVLIVRKEIFIVLVILLVIPFVPLALFIYPADEILKRLLRIVF